MDVPETKKKQSTKMLIAGAQRDLLFYLQNIVFVIKKDYLGSY